jgi:hypothetical protein
LLYKLNNALDVVDEDKFLCEFKQRVIDCFVSEAVAFFEDSPKCIFYRYIYDIHKLQFYLSRPVNYMYKPLICEYRIHAHSLKIETGRYLKQQHAILLIQKRIIKFLLKSRRLCSLSYKSDFNKLIFLFSF